MDFHIFRGEKKMPFDTNCILHRVITSTLEGHGAHWTNTHSGTLTFLSEAS
jgi:hypothetical protein